MKIKSILASAMAIFMLIACSKDEVENPVGGGGDGDTDLTEVAYLSLKVMTQPNTRASGEDDGAGESDIKSLYLITFDNNGKVIGIPGGTKYFIQINNPANAVLDPVKVSVKAEKLLVVANPGSKLGTVLNNINATSNYTSINAAIKDATTTEITDNVSSITKGFVMINSGVEDGKTAGDVIDDPLIDISSKIKKVSEYLSEQEARDEANNDRANVRIERLASKVAFKLKSPLSVLPSGATFALGGWTLDAVNEEFYPFADKKLLSVTHNVGGIYANNFYTIDPNFNPDPVGQGIRWATVNTQTYEPELVTPYTWMSNEAKTYSIENTMDAAEQKYGNATRVIIKGSYYPENGWSGDWFNFAGVNYKNLAELQAAYNSAIVGNSNLRDACDKMYNHIKTYATTNTINIEGNNFETLTESDLSKIPNGGEVLKDGREDIIRWYQDGLCYYYYQIRHDNETTQELSYGKYGVVRNNWYSLTLGTVNGAGTPWFPDIDNPGPGDPDPIDPIDESGGYLGVTVDVAPWIIWDNEIEI